MDETTVETPVLDETSLVDTTSDETSGETSELETSTEATADGTEPTGETPEVAETTNEPAIAGTKLSAAAKATLDEIRAKNPKLAAELKSALYEREALNQALPGGVKALKELQSTLEGYGGLDAIKGLKEEVTNWEAMDARFTAADPKFVDEMANASPEAFAKLAPSLFAKFNALSPDGFSKYLGEVFVADMGRNDIPLAMARLQDLIADNPKAQELFGSINNYLGRIRQFASQEVKPIAAKEPAAPAMDSERQKFEQERTEFKFTQWSTDASTQRNGLFKGEWERQTKDLKMTEANKQGASILYTDAMRRVYSSPEVKANMDKYFAANDREGFKRYVASIDKKEVPRAIAKSLESVSTYRKPGPKPGQQPTPGQKPVTTTATPGFTWATTRPTADKIDFRFTNQGMILKGQAVLKDGKKIQWKR